jgi:hypothetical protein
MPVLIVDTSFVIDCVSTEVANLSIEGAELGKEAIFQV